MYYLTVVIPVYNDENIIDEIIQKIIRICSPKIEIIIVDDCSDDNTYDLLLKFLNRKKYYNVKLLRNQCNHGPSYTRNIGIKQAKGEYIAFLDSDDDWHPQKIDIQIEMMNRYKVLICGTQHKVISKDNLKREQSIDYNNIQNIPISYVYWPKILFVSPFATPSVIIHKSLKKYLFDVNIRYAEDYNFWKRITYKHKALKIELPLTYTFKHDYNSSCGSLSTNLIKMQQGINQSFMSLLKSNKITLSWKFIIIIALIFSQIKFLRRVIKRNMSKLLSPKT